MSPSHFAPNPLATVGIASVVPPTSPSGTTTIVDHVVARYATMTINEPQNRYFLMELSFLTSAPMFRGTSIPRSARKAKAKTVTFEYFKGFHPVEKSFWVDLPRNSHTS